jgi:hypothetical protein
MYQAQLDYAPKFAQSELDLTSQYAPQYKALQDSLYPELAKLDTTMTKQAADGVASTELSPALKNQYLDQFRSEVGDQAGSGVGADYVSRSMLNAGVAQQQYYQNMALSLTGRQPLYQAQSTNIPNMAQGFNYGSVANQLQQGYGNYSSLYGNMYSTNGSNAMNTYSQNMGLIKAGIGAASSVGGAAISKWG